MPARQMIAAGAIAVIAFAYAALELRDPLVGFILGAAVVNATLLVFSIDADGRLPRIDSVLASPSSLGTARLAGGFVGSGIIITYAVWLGQSLASDLIALGLLWLFLLLSADRRGFVTPD